MRRSRLNRRRSRSSRLARFERLEPRRLLSATAQTLANYSVSPSNLLASAVEAPAIFNQAITTDAGVQQMPSVAVDPHNANHVVIAYMDYSLVSTGYAGIGVAASRDSGVTWQRSSIALPAGFDQGAANPTVRFDDQGHAYVVFMAATFFGNEKPALTNPDGGAPRALGFKANNGIFISRSDDGITWSQPAAVEQTVSATPGTSPETPNVYQGIDKQGNLHDSSTPVPFDIMPDLAIDSHKYLPDDGSGTPKSNPNYGNLYVVWSRFYPPGTFPGEAGVSTGGSQIMVAVSRVKNDISRWDLQLEKRPNGLFETVIEDGFNSGIGPGPGKGAPNWSHVAVGPEGHVYVSIFHRGDFWVFSSADGGRSFKVPDHGTGQGLPFLDVLPSPIPLPTENFRLTSLRAIAADPTRPGAVYVAEANNSFDAAGNTSDYGDVIFSRSPDSGATWNSKFQVGAYPDASVVNDDNGGQSSTGDVDDVASGQAMPQLVTDAEGDVALIWYDTRRDPANHRLDVYGTVSTDGGATFSPNFRLTDQSFDPNAGEFRDATGKQDFYLGESIGLALSNGVLYAAWTDTRQGNQDVYFSSLPLNSIGATPNDRFEPNDAQVAAITIGPDPVFKSFLPRLTLAAGEDDWFKITVPTNQLAVTAEAPNGLGSLQLEILDANGDPLPSSATTFTETSTLVTAKAHVSAGQTYFVRIHSTAGAGSVGNDVAYSLTLTTFTADLGQLVHSEVDGKLESGNEGYYLMSSAAEGSITAKLSAAPGSKIELLDQANPGSPLASADGITPQVNLSVTPGQELLVHVVVGDAGDGTFHLDLTNLDQYTDPDLKILHIPAGQGPSTVAIADINRDGILDLVSADGLADVVSVMLGNGDGTFQAPHQYDVGAFKPTIVGSQSGTTTIGRSVAVADVNQDHIPDILVINNASSDVSVLLGRGDAGGTFQPQRRYDVTANPFSMSVGDLNGDALPDVAVLDSSVSGKNDLAILYGRSDGSFQPPRLLPSPLGNQSSPEVTVKIADLNNDGRNDLIVNSDFDTTHILLNNGDGSFRRGGDYNSLGPGVAVADLNGDGNLDIVQVTRPTDTGGYVLGNGDGTFQQQQKFAAGQTPYAVAVADYDGDGVPDLIIADTGFPSTTTFGPPAIALRRGKVDSQGHFAGFDTSLATLKFLATPDAPQDVQVADLNGDKVPDIVVVERDDVLVVFGKRPAITANGSLQAARDLGVIVHTIEPKLTVTPTNPNAYYKLIVPTEAAPNAGDQVLDLSGGFADQEGAGLAMEVLDAEGNVLQSGERLRIVAHQGETLFLHIFGKAGDAGAKGAGAYTLVIDTLPQVISVEASSLLPGQGNHPGGPTTSISMVFQGDRLDTSTAEDSSNYTVTYLGPDGVADTSDDQTIAIGDGLPDGSLAVVYDSGSNIDVSSGQTFPTAVRQTVTLLFGKPLPAGSYQITVSAHVMSANFNGDELHLVTPRDDFSEGHSVVSSAAQEGAALTATNLVQTAGALGNLSVFESGNRFLVQFHGDIGALLDALLTAAGDASSTTDDLLLQVVAQFAPALFDSSGQPIVRLLVGVIDPVSIGLVDPNGQSFTYDLQTNKIANNLQNAFVEVGGNVELIVIVNPAAKYDLNVADVPAHSRGGFVYFGQQGPQSYAFTDALRVGALEFAHSFSDLSVTAKLVSSVTAAADVGTQLAGHSSEGLAFLATLEAISQSFIFPLTTSNDSSATTPSTTALGIPTALSSVDAAFTTGGGGGQDAIGGQVDPIHDLLDEVFGTWKAAKRQVRPGRPRNIIEAADDAAENSPLHRAWEIMSSFLYEILEPQAAATPAQREEARPRQVTYRQDAEQPETNQSARQATHNSAGPDKGETISGLGETTTGQPSRSQAEADQNMTSAQTLDAHAADTTNLSTTPQGSPADVHSSGTSETNATAA